MDSKTREKIKDNLLLITMVVGASGYFIADALPLGSEGRHMLLEAVSGILPFLMFFMLFLEFSKINPKDLFPKRWLIYCFIYQSLVAAAMIVVLRCLETPEWTHALWMGTLVCVISPTATAVAVMSAKLGGKAASATTYAVLSSLYTAVMVPLLFPLVPLDSASAGQVQFWPLFFKIFGKVFPVVIVPLILSLAMRRWTRKWHDAVAGFAKDKSFYIWSVCVSINMAQITRLLCTGIVSFGTTMIYLAFAAALCVFNFVLGKHFGNSCDDRISAGQSLGQKNTILSIWIAMSFLEPSCAIVMGAYMLWQNICNSLQLSNKKLR